MWQAVHIEITFGEYTFDLNKVQGMSFLTLSQALPSEWRWGTLSSDSFAIRQILVIVLLYSNSIPRSNTQQPTKTGSQSHIPYYFVPEVALQNHPP